MALVVATCMCKVLPAQAQVKFGLKGGLNISTLTFSGDVFKGDNRTGFFIGPMAEFTIPVIGLGLDVAALYNQAGGEINEWSNGEAITYTEQLKTIEIPVSVKWSFGLGSTLGGYIAVGPQFGFNVGHGVLQVNSQTFDMEKCTTTFNAGVGVKLIQHLQIGLNYNFGLGKLGRFETGESIVEIKKNTWQISLAYLF